METIGRRILFINSYEDAMELLAARSEIYSSRPHNTMAMDLQVFNYPFSPSNFNTEPIFCSEGWDWLTINLPYGDTFRKHRTYQHRFINSLETHNFLDAQLKETRKMLEDVLNNPKEYDKHVKR